MMTDANLENVLDESHELISSARVEGTPVFNPKGEKLGSVHSVMIHKHTSQVAYAVLSFGGFLGIGSHVHPLPWNLLDSDPETPGYVVYLTRHNTEQSPIMRY